MFPISKAKCFSKKKPDFRSIAAIKQQRRLCQILGGAALVAAGRMGLWIYNAYMVEAVGICGGGLVEGLGGGGNGERKGRQRDDNR